VPVIYIENAPYEVKDGQNLLAASLSLGFNVPYFCWHPAMHSIGACRLCAVKQFRDENDHKGKIVMSCMTPATEGTRISISDPDAVKFRKSVIEWLMVNHPHDCPVCDEGGECHLQDMTLLTGHVYRRFRFKKRTYRNQYLGPFINHEMNRCIQCYRCVRFYCDYAGGRDLNVFGWHDNVYFGRHEDGFLQSEFAGNLVEVCPTGVFTDKTLKQHYARKWDLQTAPSVCVHCSLGCNTIPGERYGMLRRIRNRYNREVNGYFLCDRGRFGYEFVNHSARIKQPLIRRNGNLEPIARENILSELEPIIKSEAHIIGIGSPRASVEANYALRALVGPENFYQGTTQIEFDAVSLMVDVLRRGPAPSASLHDVERADAVLVLGEDVPNTAPIAALALRQSVMKKPLAISRQMKIDDWHDMAMREAIQDDYGPCFVAAPRATRLDDIATAVYRAAPDDIARFGFAVAHELDAQAPAVPDLSDDALGLAKRAAVALRNAERPLVVSGSGCMNASLIEAAARVAFALDSVGKSSNIFLVPSSCNSMGAAMLGGKPLDEVMEAAEKGAVDTAIILENDLYSKLGFARAEKFLSAVGKVIVLDSLATFTTERADIVLPAATFAESDGTLMNNEARAQRFFKVLAPEADVQESWRWLSDLLSFSGNNHHAGWKTLDELIADIAAHVRIFRLLPEVAPPADFRISGQKVPRQPHRYSGRTAMHAHIAVHEAEPPEDIDSPLAFTMEGYQSQPPSSLIAHFWAPYWNSIQSVTKFQSEVNGELAGGDPGKRLIEPARDKSITLPGRVPAALKVRSGEVLVVPAYHVFGSEELSSRAAGIAQLSPAPYVALNQADAEAQRLTDGDALELEISGKSHRLFLKVDPSLPPGVAALPAGLSGVPWDRSPFWYELKKMKKVSANVGDG